MRPHLELGDCGLGGGLRRFWFLIDCWVACLSGLHMILLTGCHIVMDELVRHKVRAHMLLTATKMMSLDFRNNVFGR